MIIKEEELKHIIIYLLKPYFMKYGFNYIESHLEIKEKICIHLTLEYNQQTFRIDGSFLIDYDNHHIVFYEIIGKVQYSFVELSLIQVLKQILKIPYLKILDNKCIYSIKLPIEKITLSEKSLNIKVREI